MYKIQKTIKFGGTANLEYLKWLASIAKRAFQGLFSGRADDVFVYIKRIQHNLDRQLVVWDIGAHAGMWSRELTFRLRRRPELQLFEPNARNFEYPSWMSESVNEFALTVEDGMIEFFSTGTGTGDSSYRETSTIYNNVKPTLVLARSAKSLLENDEKHQPDVLKLDVQGAELDVLRGFGDWLRSVSLVYLELSLVEYNLGAPTLSETTGYLHRHGFDPIDILEKHYASGKLIQVDLLFQNRNSV